MKQVLRSFFIVALSYALLSCVQNTGGADYRNEVGANGLLTPRALFARYTEALGGESVLRSHESKTMSGSFDLSSFGLSGSMEMKVAAPNLFVQNIELGGMGTINSGFNGDVAWSVDPLSGAQRMSGQALADMARQGEYFISMTYASVYPQQETVGMSEVNGENSFEVQLTAEDGRVSTMYFSEESGLITRQIATIASPLGDVRTVTDLYEYGEFEGEILPTIMSVDQAGQQVEVTIDSVSFNDVSDADFRPPNGI